MISSASITLQLNVRPEVQDVGTPQQVSGIRGSETFGLEIPEGSVMFHRVCFPEYVDYDSSGTAGAADAHYIGEFPGFANLASGAPVPVQDWDGQPLSIAGIYLIAVRIAPRVKYYGTKAGGVLNSSNTNPSDASTVTIDTKVYTFKNTLSAVEGQVKIGANADATQLNLIRAINYTGTPGTDYVAAAMHPTVAADPTVAVDYSITVHAREYGEAGNLIATTSTAGALTWAATTLTDGADIADPPVLRPLEGTVTVTLGNELLPGSGATCNFQTASPGIFFLGTQDSWAPGSSAEIMIAYETDQPSPATNEDINALATVIIIGTP